MDLGIRRRTAVVCASTAGLGEATARALAAEGTQTVICGRRAEVAKSIAAELPDAVGVGVDLTAPDGPDAILAAAADAFGPVDILVLNSPGPPPGGSAEISGRDILQAMHTLVLPHQRLVASVLPGMRERGWGRILAIGSSGILAPIPELALSNIGRAALGGYLKTLAGEVARDGVTVNLLLPGRIATTRTMRIDHYRAAQSGVSPAEYSARSQATIPTGRYGEPAEFAAAATFLCSAAASYITGTATRCDGGLAPGL
jgi:3-oxoacyl-[acyl-carrier protein] reductase